MNGNNRVNQSQMDDFYRAPYEDEAEENCYEDPSHSGPSRLNANPRFGKQETISFEEHSYGRQPTTASSKLISGPRFKTETIGTLEHQKYRNVTMKGELISAIDGENFDSVKAAFILLIYEKHRLFNPSQYQDFLADPKISQISRFDAFTPLLPKEISLHPQADLLDKFRTMLKADINLALNKRTCTSISKQNDKLARGLDLRSNPDLRFSRSSLDGTLVIPEDETFKHTNLTHLLTVDWPAPPENHSAYDKLFSATKYILSHITKEKGSICGFTHTFSGNRARKYTKLPEHIVSVLTEMMLQVTGTADPMLLVTEEDAKTNYASHWNKLGTDEIGRARKFSLLKEMKDKVLDSKNKTIIEALNELKRTNFEDETLSPGGKLKRKRSQAHEGQAHQG